MAYVGVFFAGVIAGTLLTVWATGKVIGKAVAETIKNTVEFPLPGDET